MSLRDSFIAQRDAKLAEAKAVVEAAEVEGRDISDDELTSIKEARAAADALDSKVAELDALRESETRAASVLPTASVQVVSEPATYRKDGSHSYFRDLFNANVRGDRDALERLARNTAEVRAINTTDGSGGDLVPPVYLTSAWIEYARPGRVAADRLNGQALPSGTDTINVPKISTGATVGSTAQNAAITNTDIATATVTGAVHTISGAQTASIQLLDQSPVNLDTIVMQDLARAYAAQLDLFVLNNNAAGKYGLLNTPNKISVTYTDASPTMAELYPQIANAIQQIHTTRFEAPNCILVHPRRWAWMISQSDSSGRPLVVPEANGRFNSAGTQDGVVAQGRAGTLQGIDVYLDSQIPTNLGGEGGTQDAIIVMKSDDIMLYESAIRAERFDATLANQGSVYFRVYGYAAILARYPSVAVISGSGLANPWA